MDIFWNHTLAGGGYSLSSPYFHRKLLMIPQSRLKWGVKYFGDHAFLVCAPRLWNTLSESIKHSSDLVLFQNHTFVSMYFDIFLF